MNNEFKEIEELLAKADVGSDRYKKTIFNKLKYRMETGTLRTDNNLENNYVNKKKIFKPDKVAALALATVFIATGAAYGNQMISKIIQSFSVGNTEIVQYDMDESRNHSSNEISIKAMQEGFEFKDGSSKSNGNNIRLKYGNKSSYSYY